MCGEMASQPLMAFALIGLGVRSLSVAPRSVPLVKRIVRGVSVTCRGGSGECGARSARRRARPKASCAGDCWRRSETRHSCATGCPDSATEISSKAHGGRRASSAHE